MSLGFCDFYFVATIPFCIKPCNETEMEVFTERYQSKQKSTITLQ